MPEWTTSQRQRTGRGCSCVHVAVRAVVYASLSLFLFSICLLVFGVWCFRMSVDCCNVVAIGYFLDLCLQRVCRQSFNSTCVGCCARYCLTLMLRSTVMIPRSSDSIGFRIGWLIWLLVVTECVWFFACSFVGWFVCC